MTSLITNPEIPKRGEIWLVNFDPTVGAEIRKMRPAVVISSDAVGKLPIVTTIEYEILNNPVTE